jgi:hypothetical protein
VPVFKVNRLFQPAVSRPLSSARKGRRPLSACSVLSGSCSCSSSIIAESSWQREKERERERAPSMKCEKKVKTSRGMYHEASVAELVVSCASHTVRREVDSQQRLLLFF